MPSLSTRDALAKALLEAGETGPYYMADRLLASGAVIDATTLADDEALIDRVTAVFCEPALNEAAYREFTVDYVRALAAALSERDA